MSYSHNLSGNPLTDVIFNMRRALTAEKTFSDELMKNLPGALSQLNDKLSNLKQQFSERKQHEKSAINEKIARGKFKDALWTRKVNEPEFDKRTKEINDVKVLVKEINDGLKADKKRKQEQAKQEAAAKLEAKKDKYRSEVGFFNGYKFPENLISAVKSLFDVLQGTSAGKGKGRVTLQEKLELFLAIPDRHEKLTQLRMELETAKATNDLYDVPKLNDELTQAVEHTHSRATAILGYDLLKETFVRDGYGIGRLQPIQKNRRGGGVQALARNLEIQARQNEEARKQLIEEGIIKK